MPATPNTYMPANVTSTAAIVTKSRGEAANELLVFLSGEEKGVELGAERSDLFSFNIGMASTTHVQRQRALHH